MSCRRVACKAASPDTLSHKVIVHPLYCVENRENLRTFVASKLGRVLHRPKGKEDRREAPPRSPDWLHKLAAVRSRVSRPKVSLAASTRACMRRESACKLQPRIVNRYISEPLRSALRVRASDAIRSKQASTYERLEIIFVNTRMYVIHVCGVVFSKVNHFRFVTMLDTNYK